MLPRPWTTPLAGALAVTAALVGCARSTGGPPSSSGPSPGPGQPLAVPAAIRQVPGEGGDGRFAPGVAALAAELDRGMAALAGGPSPPYFIAYEVFDRRETQVAASYGALAATRNGRARSLDVDVRVGRPELDSTHPVRGGGDLDFGPFAPVSAAPLPLDDDAAALRAVAWRETIDHHRAATERLVKIQTQQRLKVAEEDGSADFSREPAQHFAETRPLLVIDEAAAGERFRRLSARFRGHGHVYESGVDLSVDNLDRWIVTSEGTRIQTASRHARISIAASTRADDGMELERFETFDAASLDGLPDDGVLERAIDGVIADLEALRTAPLAEPFVGPAILEGRAAGVFFHEIFGHRVEGHRQKREEEGQTFAQKVGEAIMPGFIDVWDDPTIVRFGDARTGVDLNGFYRFDDEGVPGQRATLVDGGVLRGFLLGRSPTRGFDRSNGHGRRQEGREVVARQGNLVVAPRTAVSVDELRRLLREEATRQGKPYGVLFKDISGGFTNTARYGPQAFKVIPILVYRVWADGRPDQLLRGADVVGTPLTSLSKILAAANDYATFNGFCGAESGFVPVSATSPSLLVQQIEIERKDKGDEKPPVLPAPMVRQRGGRP